METCVTAPSNEMIIAVQAPEGQSTVPSKTVPCDSQIDTQPNETVVIKNSESKVDISESVNKIDLQTENIALVEIKELTEECRHSDVLLIKGQDVLPSVETQEHVENSQMETSEQTEDVSLNINEQSENIQMDTTEQAETSTIDKSELADASKTHTTENALAQTATNAEESLEEHHPLQPDDAPNIGDMSAQQEEAEDKLTDSNVVQLLSVEDTETAELTGSDNVESSTEPVVLVKEPQQPSVEESVQDIKVTPDNLSPQGTLNHSEVQFKDDLKVSEPVVTEVTSAKNPPENTTTPQGAVSCDDTTHSFPPVTQEILKALEAAVHQCRLQSSMKRAEEANRKACTHKDSEEKEVSHVDRKVTKTDTPKTQVEKGSKQQSSRTTRSQRRKTESPEKEQSSRQRVKGSPKDVSPATSNEGSSCSSTTSRKTRPESTKNVKQRLDDWNVRKNLLSKIYNWILCESVSYKSCKYFKNSMLKH